MVEMLYWTLIVGFVGLVSGYSSGPPASSCDDMYPDHFGRTAQTGPVPYEVVLPQTTYSANEQINGKTFSISWEHRPSCI